MPTRTKFQLLSRQIVFAREALDDIDTLDVLEPHDREWTTRELKMLRDRIAKLVSQSPPTKRQRR